MSPAGDAAALIIAENRRQMRVLEQSRLVSLVSTPGLLGEEEKMRLLGYIQVQSDNFQRMMRTRLERETDDGLRAMAREHLAEEAGHNVLLAQSRGSWPVLWDPVVAAGSAWFVDSMTTLSGMGRLMLVHLVVEGGALVLLSAAQTAFAGDPYFELHAEEDEGHMDMGYEMLRSRSDLDLDEALTLLDRGWQVTHMVADRLAVLLTG